MEIRKKSKKLETRNRFIIVLILRKSNILNTEPIGKF